MSRSCSRPVSRSQSNSMVRVLTIVQAVKEFEAIAKERPWIIAGADSALQDVITVAKRRNAQAHPELSKIIPSLSILRFYQQQTTPFSPPTAHQALVFIIRAYLLTKGNGQLRQEVSAWAEKLPRGSPPSPKRCSGLHGLKKPYVAAAARGDTIIQALPVHESACSLALTLAHWHCRVNFVSYHDNHNIVQ